MTAPLLILALGSCYFWYLEWNIRRHHRRSDLAKSKIMRGYLIVLPLALLTSAVFLVVLIVYVATWVSNG